MSDLPAAPAPQGEEGAGRADDEADGQDEFERTVVGEHGASVGVHQRGWWAMSCFEGLSAEQQHRVVTHGNLPWGYEPAGKCTNGAEVEVTTMWDLFPGPRFYCRTCAVAYLTSTVCDTDTDGVA